MAPLFIISGGVCFTVLRNSCFCCTGLIGTSFVLPVINGTGKEREGGENFPYIFGGVLFWVVNESNRSAHKVRN